MQQLPAKASGRTPLVGGLEKLEGVLKGLSRFVAEVLPENRGMLTVFSRSGLSLKTEYGEDAVHVTLALTGEAS